MIRQTGPTETKVVAGALGAGAGATVAELALWGLDAAFFNGDAAPEVPGPVQAAVTLVIAAGLAYLAGRRAPHTERPDLGQR